MGLIQSGIAGAAPARWSAWRLPIIVAAVSLLTGLMGDNGREWLSFDRADIAEQGEFWRLVSGHFVHLGAEHLALNIAGLTLTWYLVAGAFDEVQWWLILVASLAMIDLGFWVLDPQLAWYVGMSGVLHGLLAAGVLGGLRSGRPEMWLLGLVLVGKIGYEQMVGPLPGSEATAGGAVIVNAHAYGAAGGLLAAIPILIRVRRRAPI